MSTAQAKTGQVEKVLEDLIRRLTSKESTADVRAALIEAKRLRTVTNRWGAIPPPPDARREMMSRVMELIAQVGGTVSNPPGAPNSEPPMRSGAAPKRQDGLSTRPPPSSEKNRSPEAFRVTEMSMDSIPSRPPRAPESERPATLRPEDLAARMRRSDQPIPAVFGSPERSRTPLPRTSRSPSPPDFEPPIATPRSAISPSAPPNSSQPPPLRGRTWTRNPLHGTPAGGLRATEEARPSQAPDAATGSGRHRAGTIMGLEAGSSLTPVPERDERKSTFPTAPPPPINTLSNKPSQPRLSGQPEARSNKSWPRRETMAMGSLGVSEALEMLADAPAPRVPSDTDERTRHTARTTPPPAGRVSSNSGSLRPASSGGPSPGGGPSPSRRPPASGSPSPIQAVGNYRAGALDGLSSAVSAPEMAAVNRFDDGRKSPSNPTMQLGTPPPPATRTSDPPDKPWRTVISPGIAVVRPEMAAWQSHPSASGVTIKLLYRDPRSGVYSALLRLAPNASLPRRRHVAPEEILVVSGVASVGEVEIRSGEYCRAEAQTTHPSISTATGCTLFLCGSEHDEYLDDL